MRCIVSTTFRCIQSDYIYLDHFLDVWVCVFAYVSDGLCLTGILASAPTNLSLHPIHHLHRSAITTCHIFASLHWYRNCKICRGYQLSVSRFKSAERLCVEFLSAVRPP